MNLSLSIASLLAGLALASENQQHDHDVAEGPLRRLGQGNGNGNNGNGNGNGNGNNGNGNKKKKGLWVGGKEFKDLDDFRQSGGRCSSKEPTAAEEADYEQITRNYVQVKKAGGRSLQTTFPVTIPIIWHNIRIPGSGPFAQEKIDDSIAVINAAFLDSEFQFDLAGVTTHYNQAWYDSANGSAEEDVMKIALRATAPGATFAGTMNVYSKSGAGNLGWANLPNGGSSSNLQDGVVIDDETVPGGNFSPFNLGDTLTHEVGHWLGLRHTFYQGCSGSGDFVSDTPAEASPAFGCPVGRNTCTDDPGDDPIYNFMDYTDDDCMDTFTPLQTDRMQALYLQYRAVGPTGGPTTPPTPAPVAPPCPAGEFFLEIFITLDNYPAETSWSLTDTCSSTALATGGSYSTSGQTIVETQCLTNGELEFTINDQYGDGICCGFGQGSYSVVLNGNQVASGGVFGGSETVDILIAGGCPSESPSNAPSRSPSVSPSKSPSESPSKAPSQSPSESPSKQPSGSPSVFPSAGPTEGVSCGASGSSCTSGSQCCNGGCIVQARRGGRCN